MENGCSNKGKKVKIIERYKTTGVLQQKQLWRKMLWKRQLKGNTCWRSIYWGTDCSWTERGVKDLSDKGKNPDINEWIREVQAKTSAQALWNRAIFREPVNPWGCPYLNQLEAFKNCDRLTDSHTTIALYIDTNMIKWLCIPRNSFEFSLVINMVPFCGNVFQQSLHPSICIK